MGLIVLSHARALAELFNLKKGIAVCGVGGKSTISAMTAWMAAKLKPQSYAVGVGEISGLAMTGHFNRESEYFIAEADEYVEDPATVKKEMLVPRFSFLKPYAIICSNLKFDHPDVYRNLAHTKQIYDRFFRSLRQGGYLIYQGNDKALRQLAEQLGRERDDIHLFSYGEAGKNLDYTLEKNKIELQIPGTFNQVNALAAMAVGKEILKLPSEKVLKVLGDFRGVKRRLEFIGERKGVFCWDDYAHHPSEIKAAIVAMQKWYEGRRVVVAFQSHTFSRTKQLFAEFVEALAQAEEVVMIDIFPSAREAYDVSISSDSLVAAIRQKYPQIKAQNVKTIPRLKKYLSQKLQAGDVFLTLGAGDIYHVYDD
jgi:UDP-N-acetylmuramate--alanine ligase